MLNRASHPKPLTRFATASLCILAISLLIWRFIEGLTLLTFLDEATHVVGGQVLDHGGLLYRDFVDSHGPLIFALAQFYGAVFGWSFTNGTRILIVAFGLAAMVSLLISPLARNSRAGSCGILLGCGLLAAVWLRQGLFLFSFYPLGGALASVSLSLFVGGACIGRFPRPGAAFAAGTATAALLATAYSFAPCFACFTAAALWSGLVSGERRAVSAFLMGIAASGLIMAVWMVRFADLHGYLSYHIAESQLTYSHYIGFGWPMFLDGLIPSMSPENRARTIGLLCLCFSLSGFVLRSTHRGPFFLVILGVLSLNARGAADFQNGSFLWAAITLAALVAVSAAATDNGRRLVLPACAILALGGTAFMQSAQYRPFGMSERLVRSLPHSPIGDRSNAPFFAEIRRYVSRDEPILALIYQPQVYLLADRLPMVGFYAWFPWDQDYSRTPHFGRDRILCRALVDRPPPVIVVDPSPLWSYAPSTVAPCLPSILSSHYVEDRHVSDVHGILYVDRERFGHRP